MWSNALAPPLLAALDCLHYEFFSATGSFGPGDGPLTESSQTFLDMATVHGLYISLLEEVLGHPVPVPGEVAESRGDNRVVQSVTLFERWLNVLDLAITAPMVRDALKANTTRGTAESLLRYYIRKRSHSDNDREKTDFVATFLYRMIIPAEKQGVMENDVDQPSEFEEEIYGILDHDEVEPLPEEHRGLVREFPFLRQEVEDFRHFDELINSGVIQRVREIKARFAVSFYHPRVLATIAEYNVFFGRRFDELFREAAQQIKQFASDVQEQGASIMSRIEGEVMVKHLTEVEEGDIMRTEYGRAQEEFRKVSRLKKAVDSRSRSAAAAASASVASVHGSNRHGAPEPSVDGVVNPAIEDGKLRNVIDQIRNFVLASDPSVTSMIVPLRNGNVGLGAAEIEAFRADFVNEKSFRADYAIALRQIVAVAARIASELREFENKQSSAYLWKPHAAALAWLLQLTRRMQETANELIATAQQRGLVDKVNSMNALLQKLRSQVQVAAKLLERAETT